MGDSDWSQMLTSWLLGKYQRKLLQVFFDNPNVSFNLRELARQADVDPGNTKRYVEKFIQMDLLSEDKVGRRKIISPNHNKPFIRKVFEIMEVNRAWDFLEKNRDYVNLKETFFFLADILKGIDNLLLVSLCCFHLDESDFAEKRINLLAVVASGQGNLGLEDAVREICQDYEIPFEVKPQVMNSQEFEKAANSEPAFFNHFWQDRVVLHGEGYLWWIIPRLGIRVSEKAASEMIGE